MANRRLRVPTLVWAIVIGLLVLLLASGLVPRPRSEQSATAAGNLAGRGQEIVVHYVVAPRVKTAPPARDVIRRTAVFPGLAEFTVHGVRSVIADAGGRQIVVDSTIQSQRPGPVLPQQEIHIELTDATGQPLGEPGASPSLATPLIAGDERRYTLTWPVPPALTQARLRVWTSNAAEAAVFALAMGDE
ncbi:MAG: hypothetical protein HYY04_18720 [Chloroflexi bacterium]|nr:hypothetical protein [Chloroflexota bacterium]